MTSQSLELIIGKPYFIIGFADCKLTVPSIGSYFYLGIGMLGAESEGKHCFQDASSFLAETTENADSNYVVLPEESLDMVTDKSGLIAWLRSLPSTGSGTT